ncbi:MAG: nucleotidyltransferase domain-containing protein [Candidatus Uhrbacteria bacterium]
MALDLTPGEREIILGILRDRLPGATVWAFGSRATGTARKTSDLDLLVRDAEPLTIRQRSQFELACSESRLPFFVDIVDERTTSDWFLKEIEDDRVLLQEGS